MGPTEILKICLKPSLFLSHHITKMPKQRHWGLSVSMGIASCVNFQSFDLIHIFVDVSFGFCRYIYPSTLRIDGWHRLIYIFPPHHPRLEALGRRSSQLWVGLSGKSYIIFKNVDENLFYHCSYQWKMPFNPLLNLFESIQLAGNLYIFVTLTMFSICILDSW